MYRIVILVTLVTVLHSIGEATPILSIFDTFDISDEILSLNHQSDLDRIDSSVAEDARLNAPALIAKYNYNGEVHSVTTEDGYILELHRISGSSKSPPKKGKDVVFLMHGLTASSSCWILSGPHHALGYRLADEGFDVWMGNARGNMYSCNHTSYKPYGSKRQQKQFWSFSWHEIGVYDLPASIDYVLKQTGQQKLQYVGHSQGTTAFFVMAAERPEYNEKIEKMHALAPAVYLTHIASPPAKALLPFVDSLTKMADATGINYLAPSAQRRKMCRDIPSAKYLCQTLIELVSGINSDQANHTLIPIIFGQSFNTAAVKQYAHYGQNSVAGEFRKFDFGRLQNLIRYNSISPPIYDLKAVTAQVAVYYAKNDWLTVVKDVQRLVAELPNVVHDYLLPHDAFNHVDFISGVDAPRLVYDEITKTMKSNTNRMKPLIETLELKERK